MQKIGNLNELTKVLSVKEQAQEQLLVVMKALGIGKIVRNLKFEKARGLYLDLSLNLAPHHAPVGKDDCKCHFQSFSWTLRRVKEHAVSRTFERPHRLANASYQNHPSLPCHSPETSVDTNEHDTCAILDDTTFQKSGIRIEGVSKVFDHVTHNFIYGMKCDTGSL